MPTSIVRPGAESTIPNANVVSASTSVSGVNNKMKTGPPPIRQWSSVGLDPRFEASGYNHVAVVPLLAGAPHSEQSFGYLMSTLRTLAARKSSSTSSSMVQGRNDSNGNGTHNDDDEASESFKRRQRRGAGTFGEEDGDDNDVNNSELSSSQTASTLKKYVPAVDESRDHPSVVLVIPNSQLTRPGDWRYDMTPLRCFDWTVGCQRLLAFDGRPGRSPQAHERLVANVEESSSGKSSHGEGHDPWMDLEYGRRSTAGVVGVLNCHDCPDTATLAKATDELAGWAERYGAGFYRMFVFDSFDERGNSLDFPSSVVAFPPEDPCHTAMMAMHLNVVINDLAVATFRHNERKIKECEKIISRNGTNLSSASLPRNTTTAGMLLASLDSSSFRSGGSGTSGSRRGVLRDSINASTTGGGGGRDNETVTSSQSSRSAGSGNGVSKNPLLALRAAVERTLTNGNSGIVSQTNAPNNNYSSTTSTYKSNVSGSSNITSHTISAVEGRWLWTPIDEVPASLTTSPSVEVKTSSSAVRDLEMLRKVNVGRRQKMVGDCCLLAGSPLDAYERYTHAADVAKSCHDPLWYASAVEGCATAYIAMADAGGHGVDDYLDQHFGLPEEVLAGTRSGGAGGGSGSGGPGGGHNNVVNSGGGGSDGHHHRGPVGGNDHHRPSSRTTLPSAVASLAEEALGIYARHAGLAALHAGLLLRLAAYTCHREEAHLHCRWGDGPGAYGGDDSSSGPSRWEKSLMQHISLGSGAHSTSVRRDYAAKTTLKRCRRVVQFLQRAVSTGALDAITRTDVALWAARCCANGVVVSAWTQGFQDHSTVVQQRIPLRRKAAYFATVAAEAASAAAAAMAASSMYTDLSATGLTTSTLTSSSLASVAHFRACRLWKAASQLYNGNALTPSNKADDPNGKQPPYYPYAWATLRASVLHALSQMGDADPSSSERAAELLLWLLSEISPDGPSSPPLSKGTGTLSNSITSSNATGVSMSDGTNTNPSLAHAFLGHNSGRIRNRFGLDSGDSIVESEYDDVLTSTGRGGGGPPSTVATSSSTLSSSTDDHNRDRDGRPHPTNKALAARTAFFAQIANPGASQQSSSLTQKWLDADPIPDMPLPLVDSTLIRTAVAGSSVFGNNSELVAAHVVGDDSSKFWKPLDGRMVEYGPAFTLPTTTLVLHSVVTRVLFETCARAQRRCLSDLHRSRARKTLSDAGDGNGNGGSGSGSGNGGNNQKMVITTHNDDESDDALVIPPPLQVLSASIVPSESHLLLEKRASETSTTAATASRSMATFFNPYDRKKSNDGPSSLGSDGLAGHHQGDDDGDEDNNDYETTLVSAGEERTILIIFANLLSVELDIPCCRLEFDDGNGGSHTVQGNVKAIEAPALSFTVPARSRGYAVHFPFLVPPPSSSSSLVENTQDSQNQIIANGGTGTVSFSEKEGGRFICLKGLRVTWMDKSYVLPVNNFNQKKEHLRYSRQLPDSAGDYPRRKDYRRSWLDLYQRGGAGAGGSSSEMSATTGRSPPPYPHYVGGGRPGPGHPPYQASLPHQRRRRRVRVEAVPPQPNLLVSFTTSLTPLEDDTTVPVHLSDGEIYTIPPFRLRNDFGPSGQGQMERLQILAVGLPGLPDEILFDTDAEAAAREVDNKNNNIQYTDDENDDDIFEELMECDGLPPLRLRAHSSSSNTQSLLSPSDSVCAGAGAAAAGAAADTSLGGIVTPVSLRSLNTQAGSVVTFQMAATHDMGNSVSLLAGGGQVRIRFRYRGPGDIWRRREVHLRILRVKGPRISSLSFRSDLSWGSDFSILSRSLAAQQLSRKMAMTDAHANNFHDDDVLAARRRQSSMMMVGLDPQLEEFNYDHEDDRDRDHHGHLGDNEAESAHGRGMFSDKNDYDGNILHRVGMDAGVHVSGDEVVVLMAVANETNHTVVLSNRRGRVGGFESSPMPTVQITSGVSVKIPVVISRIDRLSQKSVADVASDLIARTALQWESLPHEQQPQGWTSAIYGERQGRVRIPSRCLREIIDEHPAFSSKICGAPVQIKIDLVRCTASSPASSDNAPLWPGSHVTVTMEVKLRDDWIPASVLSKCAVTLEFCCAKKDSVSRASSFDDHHADHPSYLWCGQVRRRVIMSSQTFSSSSNNKGRATATTPTDGLLTHRARLAFVQSGNYIVSACVRLKSKKSSRSSNNDLPPHLTSTTAASSGEEIWWAPRTEPVVVLKPDKTATIHTTTTNTTTDNNTLPNPSDDTTHIGTNNVVVSS